MYTYASRESKPDKKTSDSLPKRTLSTTGDSIQRSQEPLWATTRNLYKRNMIHPSLKIGAANDSYEQEADHIADKIMRMPMQITPAPISPINDSFLQRDEAGNNNPILGTGNSRLLSQSIQPDFLKLRIPFFERNVPHLWDPRSALSVWNYNLNFFRRIGLNENLAARAANLTAPFAINSQLSAGNPTWWEMTDRELQTTSRRLSLPLFNFDSNFTNWQPLPFIQRKPQSADSNISVPSNFVSSLGSGQPLDRGARSFFEPRFGRDFSGVRIHTGSQAAESASSINARAYTLGNNVVFGAGEYQPGTIQGKRLMAHELTHVVQQTQIHHYLNDQDVLFGMSRASQFLIASVSKVGRLYRIVNYIEQVTGSDAQQYLVRFDQSMEDATQTIRGSTGPEADDLRGALERLRTLRAEGRITCWHTSGGLIYASYHGASGQIRLHVNFAAATSTHTILHEAIHALHAQRYPRINQLYAEVLAVGGTANEQLSILLLKWKAWTEYWAYRRVVEYENLRQIDPQFRRDAHQAAMQKDDVRSSIARVRAVTGEEFDPSAWNPPQRYRARMPVHGVIRHQMRTSQKTEQ